MYSSARLCIVDRYSSLPPITSTSVVFPHILLPFCSTDHSIRSESPNDNNASYSRLVYGNEDEQDSVSEYSGEESNNNINLNGTTGSRGSHGKPKVFSFAGIIFLVLLRMILLFGVYCW